MTLPQPETYVFVNTTSGSLAIDLKNNFRIGLESYQFRRQHLRLTKSVQQRRQLSCFKIKPSLDDIIALSFAFVFHNVGSTVVQLT